MSKPKAENKSKPLVPMLSIVMSAVCLAILIFPLNIITSYGFSLSGQAHLQKVDWISNNPLISSIKNLIGLGNKSASAYPPKYNTQITHTDITTPSPSPSPSPLTAREVYNRTRNSVVYIEVSNQSGQFTGSGIIFDNEGHIVTNRHVIHMEGQESIDVTFSDGNKFPATVIGSDHISDLAVLSISPDALATEHPTPVQLGAQSSLSIGDPVYAIGNPTDIVGAIVSGIVSQLHYPAPFFDNNGYPAIGPMHEVILTDAPFYEGNSGGGLFNQYGQLVGVTEATTQDPNLHAAIPVDTVNKVIPWLIRNGYYEYPTIGANGIDVTPQIADFIHLNSTGGCILNNIEPGRSAAAAGLQAGSYFNRIPDTSANSDADIIIGIDNNPVGDCETLNTQIFAHNINDKVSLTVSNNNQIRNILVTLGWAYWK